MIHGYCPLCQKPVAAHHPLFCSSVWPSVVRRHDNVVAAVCEPLHEAKMVVQSLIVPNRRIDDEEMTERRTPDAIFHARAGSPLHCLDVAITGYDVIQKEQAKLCHYTTAQQSAGHQPQPGLFTEDTAHPVVFDSLGRPGPKTSIFFKKSVLFTPYRKIRFSIQFQRAQAQVYDHWMKKVMMMAVHHN